MAELIPPQRYNWYSEEGGSYLAPALPRQLNIQLADPSLTDLYGAEPKNHATDSGFDLYVTEDIIIQPFSQATIDHKILCEPTFTGGYYLYPRSSISKTPLRLANSVGIIDNTYRGHIMAKVDNISDAPFTIKRGERLFQLCHPTLLPLHVAFVGTVNTNTARGAGGFGSTNASQTA
jgi:dUTP pyrophosphatase